MESEIHTPIFSSFRSGGWYEITTILSADELKFSRLNYAVNHYSSPAGDIVGVSGSFRYQSIGERSLILPFGVTDGVMTSANFFYFPPFFERMDYRGFRQDLDINDNSFSIDRFHYLSTAGESKIHTSINFGNTLHLGRSADGTFVTGFTEAGNAEVNRFKSRRT